MSLNIKENAIFIADSHFNEKRVVLLTLLKKIQSKDIYTTQLFLMGDIFDFICSQSSFFINKNSEVIDLLNELSQSIEIVYLEGNHDYNLKKLFPNIKVFSRGQQPVFATLENKSVALTHGDLFVNASYNIYCNVIRNSFLLNFLNLIDFNNWLTTKIHDFLLGKDICHKIENFESIAKNRVEHYDTDIIVEGHYHQGKTYMLENKEYINIPSLVCNKEYSVVKNSLITNISFY